MNGHRIALYTAAAASSLLMLPTTPAEAQCSPEELQKLPAADGAAQDRFGNSVAISGDTAVIGAYVHSHGLTNSGSAYVFRHLGGSWQQLAELRASDAAVGDSFGSSVAIDRDTIVVGADRYHPNGLEPGSAYVFREVAGVWQEIATLTAHNAEDGDLFGTSVAISGDTIVVGAGGSGIENSAYIFRELEGTWQQIGALPYLLTTGVTISNNTVVIGSPYFGTGLSGRAYVYRESDGLWPEIAQLAASDPEAGAYFGYSVALHSDTLVIGASNLQNTPGAAYVFHEVDGIWQEFTKLTSPGGGSQFFGRSVDAGPGRVLVGAAVGSGLVPGSGVAYLFTETGGEWSHTETLAATDGAALDFFGESVALSGDVGLVGAYWDDDAGTNSGSAYVFDLMCIPDSDCNENGIIDQYELEANDCNLDDFLDECQLGENDCNSNGIPDDCESNEIIQVHSCVEHSFAGEYCLTMGGLIREPRVTGLTFLDFDLTNNGCFEIEASIDCQFNPYSGEAVVLEANGQLVRVELDPALPDRDKCDVTIIDVAGNELTRQVRTMAGDVTNNGILSIGDLTTIKQHLGETAGPENFLYDVDVNGYINGADITAVKPYIGPCGPEEAQKLTAVDPSINDYFGYAVAISGDTVVVGVRYDDDACPELPGCDSGAAYVYRKVDGTWQQMTKLTATDIAEDDEFGISVAIQGDTAVIGAHRDDEGGTNAGAVYVFREIDGTWQEVAKLLADDAALGDGLGVSVDLNGDTVVLGASGDDDGGSFSGSAYVFREIDGAWHQMAKLTAGDASPSDFFGESVAQSGGSTIIGARGDDDLGPNKGSAYVYREVDGTWQQIAKLTAADGAIGDEFGSMVALDGNTAAITTREDDYNDVASGAVYIFRDIEGSWAQIAKLTTPEMGAFDRFGASATVNGGTIIIGAEGDEYGGAAYLFREISGSWQQIAKLKASDGQTGVGLGSAAAVDGDTAVIGARWDDYPFSNAGSAYVFELMCISAGDCNENGTPDEDEISGNDCNANGIPDECDVVSGTSADDDENGIPDECEANAPGDCDGNGVVDLADFREFTDCLVGLTAEFAPSCTCFDFNDDGRVTLEDFGLLQILLGN